MVLGWKKMTTQRAILERAGQNGYCHEWECSSYLSSLDSLLCFQIYIKYRLEGSGLDAETLAHGFI